MAGGSFGRPGLLWFQGTGRSPMYDSKCREGVGAKRVSATSSPFHHSLCHLEPWSKRLARLGIELVAVVDRTFSLHVSQNLTFSLEPLPGVGRKGSVFNGDADTKAPICASASATNMSPRNGPLKIVTVNIYLAHLRRI